MQLSLELDEHVVFDLETTGLSAWGGDEIIEIGAMRIFGREIDEKNIFHSLVNPGRLIPHEATRVNGITNEMVAAAPTLIEILPKFLEFVGEANLVAQNAKFDMGFVMKSLAKFKIKKNLEVSDTMVMSRRAFPGESRHNLDVICQRLGISVDGANRHRSIDDVRLTAKAFLLLSDKLGDKLPHREKWTA